MKKLFLFMWALMAPAIVLGGYGGGGYQLPSGGVSAADTAVLSHLSLRGDLVVESDTGLAGAAGTYIWTDGSRPRTIGADYRVYNDVGFAISQTNAGSTAFSFGSGIEVRMSKLTSHGGTDLEVYAPTGQLLKLMSPAGAGTKFYIDASGDVIATPTVSMNVASGNLVVSSGNIQGDNVLNAAGTGPPTLTFGADVAAGAEIQMGEGSTINTPTGGSLKFTAAKVAFVSSPSSTFYSYSLIPNDSTSSLSVPSLRGNSIWNAGSNTAPTFKYGIDVAAGEAINVDNIYDSTGLTRPSFPVGLNVDDQIRMVDASGIAFKTSGGTNVFVLGTDRSYFYKPAVFSETAPVSNITNMVQLYAADNVGVNTLYGRNDAGTDKILAP